MFGTSSTDEDTALGWLAYVASMSWHSSFATPFGLDVHATDDFQLRQGTSGLEQMSHKQPEPRPLFDCMRLLI